MAYDEALAESIRTRLAVRGDVEERRMFGGLTFMVAGHMACGVMGRELMVRMDPEAAAAALERPGVRPMDFTGRPMKAFVIVEPGDDLDEWVDRAVAHAEARPPRRGEAR